ncbi:uncharacterized protein LOC106151403 [Lingula anatina]|uniref:Uncharacterized protein LOC106151403 n=1 Tax=Lingula anatina TaxID=7574 RepID=A0A1S3H3Q8_LINAN|nr:uncharacterized protein LOC106151403 [Lingula anatina]|eukprot:XP_013380101.1 uncharacterized protein LOC106151403 [Lingula anatina]
MDSSPERDTSANLELWRGFLKPLHITKYVAKMPELKIKPGEIKSHCLASEVALKLALEGKREMALERTLSSETNSPSCSPPENLSQNSNNSGGGVGTSGGLFTRSHSFNRMGFNSPDSGYTSETSGEYVYEPVTYFFNKSPIKRNGQSQGNTPVTKEKTTCSFFHPKQELKTDSKCGLTFEANSTKQGVDRTDCSSHISNTQSYFTIKPEAMADGENSDIQIVEEKIGYSPHQFQQMYSTGKGDIIIEGHDGRISRSCRLISNENEKVNLMRQNGQPAEITPPMKRAHSDPSPVQNRVKRARTDLSVRLRTQNQMEVVEEESGEEDDIAELVTETANLSASSQPYDDHEEFNYSSALSALKEGKAVKISADKTPKPTRQKRPKRTDQNTPGSEWGLDMLAKYISFKHTVRELIMPFGISVNEEAIKSIRREIKAKQSVLQMAPLDGFQTQTHLEQFSASENDARIILDTILMQLCLNVGLKMTTEQTVDSTCMPTNKYDYRFYKDEICIGCLEAKGKTNFNEKGAVQAIMQLLLLQLENQSKDLNVKRMPFFNILSDGFHFMFVRLEGKKLCFETDQSSPDSYGGVLLRKADTWRSLEDIMRSIAWCMDESAKASVFAVESAQRKQMAAQASPSSSQQLTS